MSRNHGVYERLWCSFVSNINWAPSLSKESIKRGERASRRAASSFSREEKGAAFNSRKPRDVRPWPRFGRCTSFWDRSGDNCQSSIILRSCRPLRAPRYPRQDIVESSSEAIRQKFDTAIACSFAELVLFRRGWIPRTWPIAKETCTSRQFSCAAAAAAISSSRLRSVFDAANPKRYISHCAWISCRPLRDLSELAAFKSKNSSQSAN